MRESSEKNNKSRLEKQRTSLRDEIAKLLNLKMSCSETAIFFWSNHSLSFVKELSLKEILILNQTTLAFAKFFQLYLDYKILFKFILVIM